jgi:hypothetical protein
MTQKSNKSIKNAPKFIVSTFNAQSISNDSYLLELEYALKEIKYDVIGLSEVKRIGEGRMDMNGYIFFYSGKERRRGTVGFIVNSKWKNNISAFKSYSDRVISLEMKFTNGSLGLIQAYAPTSSSNEKEIEDFYDQLSIAINEMEKNSWLIILGDFNAKIGKSNGNESEVVGPFGLGERNDRGEMLLNFARSRELFISNTQFKKRLNRRWTWHLGRAWNEIDYIITRKSQKNLVTDVSVVNNFKFNSDHRLLRMKIRLGIKPTKKFQHPSKKVVVQKDESKVLKFNRNLQERLLPKSVEDIQKKYNNFCDGVLESAEVFRVKKVNKNIIITVKTRKEIDKREMMKRQRFESVEKNSEFKKQRKKTIKLIRKDVHEHEIQQIQKAIEEGNSLRTARNGYAPNKCWISQLKNQDNVIVSNRSEVVEVAAKFYENLYKSTMSEEEVLRSQPELQDENDEYDKVTMGEIEFALASMKNDKATGSDEISSDLFKICDKNGLQSLVDLFNEILETEDIPSQWFESTIILIHKKGDRKDLSNYRPITLTSHIYKLFMKVLLNKVSEELDQQQPSNQAAFRKGFSTTDHLFVMNQLIEKSREFNKPLVCAFVDYSKAFDSVEHPFLWVALKEQGMPLKLIRILKKIYENSRARIKMETYSRWFKIERGIKQGDPFSPKAFNAALERIFKKINWQNRGLKIDKTMICELRFADDVVLISDNEQNIASMMSDVFQESKVAGLSPNVEKTKIFSNTGVVEILVNGQKFTATDDYIYLGQVTSFNETEGKQIDARISSAWKSFWGLKKFFKSFLPLHLKKSLFDACVLPVFTYGAQTWTQSEDNMKKLEVAQRSMERSMLHKKKKDRISNTKLRKSTKLKDVVSTAKELKWNWAGHVARYSEHRLPLMVEKWIPQDCKRSQGRPKRRWKDQVVETASIFWRRKAQNRENWKKMGTSFIRN